MTSNEAAAFAVLREHEWADLAAGTDPQRQLVHSVATRALARAGLVELDHGRARLTDRGRTAAGLTP